MLTGITRKIMQDHADDTWRAYYAGKSARGASASILGVAYPDRYAVIGVHSGLACGTARDVPSAFAAMRQRGTAVRQHGSGSPKAG